MMGPWTTTPRKSKPSKHLADAFPSLVTDQSVAIGSKHLLRVATHEIIHDVGRIKHFCGLRVSPTQANPLEVLTFCDEITLWSCDTLLAAQKMLGAACWTRAAHTFGDVRPKHLEATND